MNKNGYGLGNRWLRDILLTITFIVVFASCEKPEFYKDFNQTNDRVWVGNDFWSVPLEDWRVHDGRLECVGARDNMKVNLLTRVLNGKGDVRIIMKMGLNKKSETEGEAGISIGLTDETDRSMKSLCYFGMGTDIGISTSGYVFIGQSRKMLPSEFDYQEFQFKLLASGKGETSEISLIVTDRNGETVSLKKSDAGNLNGSIAVFNNLVDLIKEPSLFWFDDLSVSGSMVDKQEKNSFGPILWSMYTLSRNILKISAQMPPLGKLDNSMVQLEINKNGNWETKGNEKIDIHSRLAVFRVEDWDSSKDHEYRLVYEEKFKNGSTKKHYYSGIIRQDPKEKTLKMGALTCQFHYGFPYTPVVKNLTYQNPDILYFSGDQIYEGNGGYGIIRFPEDKAILNYLGKWYMFGWAFGDLMRDRPTICIPDDHECFQGNLWGASGKKVSFDDWEKNKDCVSGFVQTPEMVNVVMRTNCSHLPDPFDPEPMENGIDVYYTDLVYGKVSFGIVGDRIFKDGPEKVKCPELVNNYFRERRLDLIVDSVKDVSVFEKPDLKFLGDRQMKFLDHWIEDWQGVDMKVLLSQTLFSNNTTHYGSTKSELYADLDSGGWPKSGRDKALKTIRKCAAFHICGDQHLPALMQYGTDNYRDAGWAFCTPAITVVYQRRFLPDLLGREIINRPAHNHSNTGYYMDGFGNPSYIYAVGNPDDNVNDMNRFKKAEKSASGYGMVSIDTEKREITASAYHFLADVSVESPDDQFPGWPKTIHQFENFGQTASEYLPNLEIIGHENPLVKIFEEQSNQLVLSVRIKGHRFLPKVYKKGSYKIMVGNSKTNTWNTIPNVKSVSNPDDKKIKINLK